MCEFSQWRLVENSEDATKLLKQLDIESSNDQLKELSIKCSIKAGMIGDLPEFEEKVGSLLLAKDDQTLHSVHHLRAIFHLFVDKNFTQAWNSIRKAMAFAETDIEDTLVAAQILIARGNRQLANTQLVNAAKEASEDWRIFYWLAENLAVTGPMEKAKICVEHACKLNPGSALSAKLLDKIFVETNSPDSVRLNALHKFISHRPNSMWGLCQAAILEINTGKLDQAIDKCQRVIRLMTNAFGEHPEMLEQRQKHCSMWALLSEAYRQKGNFQSAVRACRVIISLEETNYTAKLQLIKLYQGMCQYNDAIAFGESFEREFLLDGCAKNGFPANLVTHFRTMHLLSLVLRLNDPEMRAGYFIKIQLELLPEILSRTKLLLDETANSSLLLYKCLEQALKTVQSFNLQTFNELRLNAFGKSTKEGGWGIGSQWELARMRIQCLIRILQGNRRAADSWNDLGMAFLDVHLLASNKTEADNMLESAIQCLQRAIRTTNSKLKRSEFYCNLGRVYIRQRNAFRAQHCFFRAQQLNRHSDTAWTLLSLLYLQLGLNDEALEAMNNAQKINPSRSEAWCSHAIHAERTNHYDTMDLYRHALVLKPSFLATQKYCQYLMHFRAQRKHMDEGTMINFETFKNLYHTFSHNQQYFVHALACLAEHFWYLDGAEGYFCGSRETREAREVLLLARNRERVMIKTGSCLLSADELEHNFPGSGLKALKVLYGEVPDALYARLKLLDPLRDLTSALLDNDSTAFSRHYKPALFPLIASISIIFRLPLSPAICSTIESIRPLHRLFEVFSAVGDYRIVEPMLAPHEEEEVLVRHDHLTDQLYSLLKQKLSDQQEKCDDGQ